MKNKGKYFFSNFQKLIWKYSKIQQAFKVCFLIWVIASIVVLPLFDKSKRPMIVDDLFTIEQLHNTVVCPDCSSLAVVIKRARTNAEKYKKDYLFENDHADIWLVSSHEGEPQNLTNGIRDGSGYWNPVWSPDGKRIAILSTKGGDNVRLYIYEKDQGILKRLMDQGVELESWANGEDDRYFGLDSYITRYSNPYIWISNTRLLCPIVPEREQSVLFKSEIETPRIATREWPKAEYGTEPTMSVLESGYEIPEKERPKGGLLLIDVISGKNTTLAEGNFRHIILSPSRKYAGLVADTGGIQPNPKRLLRRGNLRHSKFGILSLENGFAVRWISTLFDPKIGFMEVPHGWAPDGSSIAVIAKANEDDEGAETLFLITPQNAKAQKMTNKDLKVSSFYWKSPNELLIYASSVRSGKAKNNSRFDWWLIDPYKPEEHRNITIEMESVPSKLLSSGINNIVFGIAADDLWSINIRNGSIQNLTDNFNPQIESIIWPKTKYITQTKINELVVQTKSLEHKEFFRIDISNFPVKIAPFPKPSSEALLANYIPEKKLAVLTAAEPDGTFLWTGDGSSNKFTKRITLNEHLSQIADSKHLVIEYRGIEGDSLKALLFLPLGYESGKRYPLVTVVYAGAVAEDWISFEINKNNPSFLNYSLLPSHGYAVLFPSMPLPPEGETSDPYIEMPKGVFPAIDKVIEMGIADPEKLGVLGHSFGGYSTYSLITFTDRFKAAVSMAGISNLISLYGVFDARRRYGSYPHEHLFAPRWCEYGQPSMGDTLWGNLWRYIRNSPIYFLDRVKTPLLIIHADIDYIAMQQGEEFFMGLYRLGKRAKFVRYWGDSHTIESPANIQDMWQRIFNWFDYYLENE